MPGVDVSIIAVDDCWIVSFFFSSRRRHTRFDCDWSSDVCSSDLLEDLELMPSEPLQVTSSDGQVVHGWLIKPPGFSERKKWPLILEVHGGPETMYAEIGRASCRERV